MREARLPVTVTVNGEARPCRGQTLAELIAESGIDPGRRGIAVAVNAQLVPREAWPATRIAPGDEVEIVQPLAGG